MSIQDETAPPHFDWDCSAIDNINHSISLPISDKNESTNAHRSSSEITNASEPTNGQSENSNKQLEFSRNTTKKAFSYQDIHSEYTKKRFKHVESKVGQYIANMRAQAHGKRQRHSDEFIRCRSLPETLIDKRELHSNTISTEQKFVFLRQKTDDSNNNNTPNQKVESNFEPLINIDQDTYTQLLSEKERNDYLQEKLDEKNTDILRLKKNIDYMRFELAQCKDKLQQTTTKLHDAKILSSSYRSVSVLGMQTKQSWRDSSLKFNKSTQTDITSSSSPMPHVRLAANAIFNSSITPDCNNNSFDYKRVGVRAPVAVKKPRTKTTTIQPISLNFSNTNKQEKHDHYLNTTENLSQQQGSFDLTPSKQSELTFSDNKTVNHFIISSSMTSHSEANISLEKNIATNTQPNRSNQEQLRDPNDCSHYLKRIENNTATIVANSNYITNESNSSILTTTSNDAVKACNEHKCRGFRSRIIRLFRSCTRCDNPNRPLNNTSNNKEKKEQSYIQIPLLGENLKNPRRNETYNCNSVSL
uniref:Uncharacterized protein n=1 Tax=Glossina brevipalpis TaxID=37001 RepID=A0A1A9WSP8_9MUSC